MRESGGSCEIFLGPGLRVGCIILVHAALAGTSPGHKGAGKCRLAVHPGGKVSGWEHSSAAFTHRLVEPQSIRAGRDPRDGLLQVWSMSVRIT